MTGLPDVNPSYRLPSAKGWTPEPSFGLKWTCTFSERCRNDAVMFNNADRRVQALCATHYLVQVHTYAEPVEWD